LAKLAHLYYILGEFSEGGEKAKSYQRGCYFAEILCKEHPDRVEGHYWLALNLCGICESCGAASALTQIPKIVKLLEFAATIDQAYDQGGPLRVLGLIRLEAPPWPLSEGDITEALKLLSTAVRIAPNNSTNHLYLAKILMQLDKVEDACLELNCVLASTDHSIPDDGLSEDQKEALAIIGQCRCANSDFQTGSSISAFKGR
jgi:tetratricopeptide (TPR) repeat protein